MPEYDIKGSDGNYKVRADNAQDAQNAVNQQEFGTATMGAVGAVLSVAKFIPSLICMAIGFITGLLLKLGIVGRIILTAIFAVCVFILTALPLQYFFTADSGLRKAIGVVLWLALTVTADVQALYRGDTPVDIPAGSSITVTEFARSGPVADLNYIPHIIFNGRDELWLKQLDVIKPVE